MTDEQQPCVLVGSDGARRHDDVLEVAALEAVHRRLPLVVAATVPAHELPGPGLPDHADAEVTARLDATAERARRVHPGLRASTALLPEQAAGSPPSAPAQAGPAPLAGARLLVVGARGSRGTPLGLGAMSWGLVRAVACPVLVAPSPALAAFGRGHTTGPVVVGIGQDPDAAEVLREAVAAARARRTAVRLVHAVRRRPGEPARTASARACARSAELVRRARVGLDVPVSTLLSTEEPAAALRRCASRASLLVIGSHRPTTLAGRTAASVGRGVIDGVPCPVLVVVHRGQEAASGAATA